MTAHLQILETSLYVEDLARSEHFYRDLFGFPTVMGDERMRALRINETQILLLFAHGKSKAGDDTPGGRIPGHDGASQLHLAFAIESSDVARWKATLAESGVELISRVKPEQGGDCLYFRDPDGHLIELATPNIWPSAAQPE